MEVDQHIGLDNCYRLLALYAKQIGDLGMQLGKLRNDLARRRNYVRVCDLEDDTKDRDDGTSESKF